MYFEHLLELCCFRKKRQNFKLYLLDFFILWKLKHRLQLCYNAYRFEKNHNVKSSKIFSTRVLCHTLHARRCLVCHPSALFLCYLPVVKLFHSLFYVLLPSFSVVEDACAFFCWQSDSRGQWERRECERERGHATRKERKKERRRSVCRVSVCRLSEPLDYFTIPSSLVPSRFPIFSAFHCFARKNVPPSHGLTPHTDSERLNLPKHRSVRFLLFGIFRLFFL